MLPAVGLCVRSHCCWQSIDNHCYGEVGKADVRLVTELTFNGAINIIVHLCAVLQEPSKTKTE